MPRKPKRIAEIEQDISPVAAGQAALMLQDRAKELVDIHPDLNPATMRPFGITREQRVMLIDLLRKGNFLEPACLRVGISVSTARAWIKRGGDPETEDDDREQEPVEPYKSFAREVRQAQAEAEIDAVEQIRNAGNVDWRASAYLISRRNPDRWAEQKQQAQVAFPGANIQIVLPDNQRSVESLPDGENV